MTDHQEAWQVFAANGVPVDGEEIAPKESRMTEKVIVGAVHVWMWRRTEQGIEVLLQLRAKDKPTWPGYLDISVAGHVDAGESLMQAAVREGEEEIGVRFDTSLLEYIFSYRNFTNGLKWIYLYDCTGQDDDYKFNDGEVESLEWIPLTRFEAMANDPKSHKLVEHPAEYYSWLLKALNHFSSL